MTEKTAWEKAAAANGTTPSERALASLARKAFLSLWSYPNVFTDEGRANGKGDGKEFCNFLVVFRNNVLLFSDRDCAQRLVHRAGNPAQTARRPTGIISCMAQGTTPVREHNSAAAAAAFVTITWRASRLSQYEPQYEPTS